MQAPQYTDYDSFAWLYNTYWSERLIRQIYWTIEKYLLDRLSPESRVLDVCCGNAHLSAPMTQRGFQVTGIDGSAEMLRYARQNSPTSTFMVADARDFSFDPIFDAAVCTCDSFNHIMAADELERAFINVYRALKPGGRFLFDLNTEEGYRAYWTGKTAGRVADDHAYLVTLSYDEEDNTSRFEATLFRLIDGNWTRSDAVLTQKFYPTALVLGLLKKIGFIDIEVYDVEKDLKVAGTGRVMYVMRRE